MQTASESALCKDAHMDAQQQATKELVLAMLAATELSPTELARAAGLAPSTLTRFLNSPVKHSLSARTLAKLSATSGVAVPSSVQGLSSKVVLVGYVGAAEEVFPVDEGALGSGLEWVEVPYALDPDCVGVRVTGASMFPAYWEGDLLIFKRDFALDLQSCLYNECIVKVAEGPTYIKRLMPGGQEGRFNLVSYNASQMTDMDVEWAASVMIHDKRFRRAKNASQPFVTTPKERLEKARQSLQRVRKLKLV